MLYYESQHHQLPNDPAVLVEKGFAPSKVFLHPAAPEKTLRVINGKFDNDISYVIFLDHPEDYDYKRKDRNSSRIRAYTKPEFGYRGEVEVLTSGGSVKKMSLSELNQQLIAEGRPPAWIDLKTDIKKTTKRLNDVGRQLEVYAESTSNDETFVNETDYPTFKCPEETEENQTTDKEKGNRLKPKVNNSSTTK